MLIKFCKFENGQFFEHCQNWNLQIFRLSKWKFQISKIAKLKPSWFETLKGEKFWNHKTWNVHTLKPSRSKLLNFKTSRAVNIIKHWIIFKTSETFKFQNFQDWNLENWNTKNCDFSILVFATWYFQIWNYIKFQNIRNRKFFRKWNFPNFCNFQNWDPQISRQLIILIGWTTDS